MQDLERTWWYGRLLLYLFLVGWGIRFIAGGPDAPVVLNSFMHNVNLPLHEAGHVLFGPFGWFIGVLGGTLMQLLVPLLFVITFLVKEKNSFGSAVTLWWLGQNFMDIAPYVGDARAQRLLLLGGVTGKDVPGYHDWNNILGHLGWLEKDQLIASISYDIGRFLMVAMFLWGGYLLLVQFNALNRAEEAQSRVDEYTPTGAEPE
ncbi:hypothetical protein ACFL3H_04755 [Gemmatimonadota bacterium]